MAEAPSAAPEASQPAIPKKICEKCRNAFPLEALNHSVEGQECVGRRCLAVMGYQV